MIFAERSSLNLERSTIETLRRRDVAESSFGERQIEHRFGDERVSSSNHSLANG